MFECTVILEAAAILAAMDMVADMATVAVMDMAAAEVSVLVLH